MFQNSMGSPNTLNVKTWNGSQVRTSRQSVRTRPKDHYVATRHCNLAVTLRSA